MSGLKLAIKKIIGKHIYWIYNWEYNHKLPLLGTYGSFRVVSAYSEKNFKKLKKYNDYNNVNSLIRRNKIKVGFVVYSSSMWTVEELYLKLSNNPFFMCEIIVAHLLMKDDETSAIEYERTYKYFKRKGFKTVEAKMINRIGDYHILFYLTPFASFKEKKISLYHIPFSVLVLHTSYSYMLSDNNNKTNLWMYHFSYAYYTDSNFYKNKIENSKHYTGNAKYLGFPKMDQYFTAKCNRKSKLKTIIYAPHHSVNYKENKSSTFELNYKKMLELAQKYNRDTYWIYKPHPLLRSNSVVAGLFDDGEEYDKYEQEWDKLDNAEVVTTGDYYSIFKGSDAMITDSVSFLAEYQFTHKPLLLLESGKEQYNEFGDNVVEILYKCSGNDFNYIDGFIKDVISDRDQMLRKRKKFFREYLDYMKDGKTANCKIYEDILRFTGKNDNI